MLQVDYLSESRSLVLAEKIDTVLRWPQEVPKLLRFTLSRKESQIGNNRNGLVKHIAIKYTV